MRLALAMMVATTGAALADPQEDVMRCWSPPSGARDTKVEIAFNLDRDGALVAAPTSPQSASTDLRQSAAVEAGFRAVRRCSPYDVPAGIYRVFFPEAPSED